jgi:hypothetical protein
VQEILWLRALCSDMGAPQPTVHQVNWHLAILLAL